MLHVKIFTNVLVMKAVCVCVSVCVNNRTLLPVPVTLTESMLLPEGSLTAAKIRSSDSLVSDQTHG
jgi:hypothetical protein